MPGGNTVVTLSRVARTSFTGKVTFQKEVREGAVLYLGEECPGRGGDKCKVPEARECLMHPESSEESLWLEQNGLGREKRSAHPGGPCRGGALSQTLWVLPRTLPFL